MAEISVSARRVGVQYSMHLIEYCAPRAVPFRTIRPTNGWKLMADSFAIRFFKEHVHCGTIDVSRIRARIQQRFLASDRHHPR
jgi:hypothetical protein